MPDTHSQIRDRVYAATEKLPVLFFGAELRNMFLAKDLSLLPDWVQSIHEQIRESIVNFTVICDALQPTSSADEEHPK